MSSSLSHFKSSVSRHCSGKGPHLALRGESCGCSQVATGSDPGDSNPGETNPGDSPHSAASVVSFPGHFSGHLAHILYTCSCTHAHTHTHTHTHTQALFFFRAQEILTSSQHVKPCSGKNLENLIPDNLPHFLNQTQIVASLGHRRTEVTPPELRPGWATHTGIGLSAFGRSSLGKRFSLNFSEDAVVREMGGHAQSHRSGAEALSVFGVREPADSRNKSVGDCQSFSSCFMTECQGGGKGTP